MAEKINPKPDQVSNLKRRHPKSSSIYSGPASRTRTKVKRSSKRTSSRKQPVTSVSVPALKSRTRRSYPRSVVMKNTAGVLSDSLQFGTSIEMSKKSSADGAASGSTITMHYKKNRRGFVEATTSKGSQEEGHRHDPDIKMETDDVSQVAARSNLKSESRPQDLKSAGDVITASGLKKGKPSSGRATRTRVRASLSRRLPNISAPVPEVEQRRSGCIPSNPAQSDADFEVAKKNYNYEQQKCENIPDIDVISRPNLEDYNQEQDFGDGAGTLDKHSNLECSSEHKDTVPAPNMGEDIHSNFGCDNQEEKCISAAVVEQANKREICTNVGNENYLKIASNTALPDEAGTLEDADGLGRAVIAGEDLCRRQELKSTNDIATQTEPLSYLGHPFYETVSYPYCPLDYGLSCPCVRRKLPANPQLLQSAPLIVLSATIHHLPPMSMAELLLFVYQCINSLLSQPEVAGRQSALDRLQQKYNSLMCDYSASRDSYRRDSGTTA